MSDKVVRKYSRPYGDCRADKRLYFGGAWPWQPGAECEIPTPSPSTAQYILDISALADSLYIYTGSALYNPFSIPLPTEDYASTYIELWQITSNIGDEPPFTRTLITYAQHIVDDVWQDNEANIIPLDEFGNLNLTSYISALPVNTRIAIGFKYDTTGIDSIIPCTVIDITSGSGVSATTAVGPAMSDLGGYGFDSNCTDNGDLCISNTVEQIALNTWSCLDITNPATGTATFQISAIYPGP